MDRRFALLAASFIASIGFVYFLLFSEYRQTSSFTQSQIDGVEYLRPAKNLMQHLPEHRWLMREYLAGNISAASNVRRLQAQVDEDLEQLMEAERRYSSRIRVSASLRNLARDWGEFKQTSLSVSLMESEHAHQALSAVLWQLVRDIGDESKLMLDPDLDSYYLMYVLVMKLPDIQELIPQVMDVSARFVKAPTDSPMDRMRLTQLLGILQSTLDKMERSYDRALSSGRAFGFKATLKASWQDFAGTTEGYIGTLTDGMLGTGAAALTEESVQMLGAKLYGKSFELWDATSDGLQKLFKKRLVTTQRKAFLASVFTFTLALVTVALAFLLVQASRERQKMTLENERLAQAVDAASDGILITDPNQPDNPVIYANTTFYKLTGYAPEEVLGRNCRFLQGAQTDETVKRQIREAVQKREHVKLTILNYRKDGTTFWNALRISPVFSRDGRLKYFLGFQTDVSDRIAAEREMKALESQLQQSQKLETVGTLAGGIAHDLNNQLTPLAGYLDLALKDTPPEDPRRGLLQEAEEAARRCAEVVHRLLSVTRPSTQKKNWFKLDQLMAETKSLLAKSLPATIETEVVCSPDIWPVFAKDSELQTVMMALAVNSRDAMPGGGRFMIRAENVQMDERKVRAGFKSGPYVMLAVTDTGGGIPPETLPKIFDPFFTTKPKGRSTGLGLTMVFRVVKDHGGWVEASSELGKGTTIALYLPADPSGAAAPKADDRGSQAIPGGSETILFADDEEALRGLGRVFLEKLGYRVVLARDGEEAVDLYKERHGEISAVILDMTMPKLTGQQTLKKLLEIDPKAKVLLASGFTAEGTAKELMQQGAMDFLTKPYTIYPLAQMLRKVIDK